MRSKFFNIVLLVVVAAVVITAATAQAQSCLPVPADGGRWLATSGPAPSFHPDHCMGVHVGNNTAHTRVDLSEPHIVSHLYMVDLDSTKEAWSVVFYYREVEVARLEGLHTGQNERSNIYLGNIEVTRFDVINPDRDSHGVNVWGRPAQTPIPTATVTAPPTQVVTTPEPSGTPTEPTHPPTTETEVPNTPEPTATAVPPTSTPSENFTVECYRQWYEGDVYDIAGELWEGMPDGTLSVDGHTLQVWTHEYQRHLKVGPFGHGTWMQQGEVREYTIFGHYRMRAWWTVVNGSPVYRCEPVPDEAAAPTLPPPLPFNISPLPSGWDPYAEIGHDVDAGAVVFDEGVIVWHPGDEVTDSNGDVFVVPSGCLFFQGGGGDVEFTFNDIKYSIVAVEEWQTAQPSYCLYDQINGTFRAVAGSTVSGFAVAYGISAGDLTQAAELWGAFYGDTTVYASENYKVPHGWQQLAQ